MWLNNEILRQDLDSLLTLNYIPWEKLRGKTVLVTGATGLIGFNLISGLLYADLQKKLGLRVLALVRNIDKAREKFSMQLSGGSALELIPGEVERLPDMPQDIDYIVHAASPTESAFFIAKPVETIKTAVVGTINILELARAKRIKGMAYLSSMEIYGAPRTEDVLTETDLGDMNPLLVRNCYPESKRQCEALCAAYADEYGIPAVSVRLAQTFGVGVDERDSRVFAEFARCAMERKDIVLLTDGKSKRCYLYTMDAVSAILTVLLKGEAGTAYNAANPSTYCSVKEMAEFVAQKLANGKIHIKLSENSENCKKFPPPHFYNLGVARLEALGWRAQKGLEEMYWRMVGGA